MNAPIVTISNTATQHLLLVQAPDMTKSQAEWRALEYYYYDDGYVLPDETKRATDYAFGGAHYAGWLVKVLH